MDKGKHLEKCSGISDCSVKIDSHVRRLVVDAVLTRKVARFSTKITTPIRLQPRRQNADSAHKDGCQMTVEIYFRDTLQLMLVKHCADPREWIGRNEPMQVVQVEQSQSNFTLSHYTHMVMPT
jgi:hypothetical protein